MNWKKRQKNYKSLRICFKMRKFFFILQYIVVFLQNETNEYEQDSICIDYYGNAHVMR